MKLKFNYKFTMKRILALVQAFVAIGTFFTLFVPSIKYTTTYLKTVTSWNGFVAYCGYKGSSETSQFACTFGGIFYILLLFVIAALAISKMFVNEREYKKLNITALVLTAIALIFIACAPTRLMCNPTGKYVSQGLFYYVGAWIQIGLTLALGIFFAVDEFAIKA